MHSKRPRSVPATGGLTSRREVLRRGAAIAAVSAIAPMWPRFAKAQSATTFDYYISTTGSDSNPGTQAAPWAISSLCRYQVNGNNVANNAAMAGKTVGILSGTYNVGTYLALAASNNSGNPGYAPGLSIPSGTAASPTVIKAVNLGQAIINAQSSSALASTMGQSDDIYPNQGYVTIDGLVFQNPPASGHNVILGGSNNSSPQMAGWVVQNCTFNSQNFSAMESGNNGSAIDMCGAVGAIIRNNYLYQFTGQGGATNGGHVTATQQWFSSGVLYEYNTCIGPGFYGKETGNSGTTIRYNYVDNTGWSQVFCVEDFVGETNTPTGSATYIYNNVFVGASDMRPTLGGSTYLPDPFYCYNNTFYVQNIPDAESTSIIIRVVPGGVTWYNNIIYMAASGDFHACANRDGVKVWDYNCYYATSGYQYGYYPTDTTVGPPTIMSTLAALVAVLTVTTSDAHTLNATNPALVSPGSQGASNYQLSSGSPCIGAGRTGGSSGGSPVDMGAWGGADVNTNQTVAQIGCSFGPGATSGGSGAAAAPDAPVLTVS